MPELYLVTGGAGFIGRHLCDELLAAGHRVRVLDCLVSQVHAGERPSLPDDVEFIEGDVRDTDGLGRALDGVDGVFHLAAEVGVGQSMYEIARYVSGNDFGTAVLLERLSNRAVRRLVVASSMSVYGEGLYLSRNGVPRSDVRRGSFGGRAKWDPADEAGEPLIPIPTDESKSVDVASIYALTKFVQEQSCLIVGRAYGIEVVALRLFNVFGRGQALSNPYTGVLANFGARLANGQRPLVFEDGRQKRDFVSVTDVATAFRLAMERSDAAGRVFNVGSGRCYEIAEVAEMLAEAMGVPHLEPRILGEARAGDIRHCFADIALARSVIGYEPGESLESAIGGLADWIASSASQDGGENARRALAERGLVA